MKYVMRNQVFNLMRLDGDVIGKMEEFDIEMKHPQWEHSTIRTISPFLRYVQASQLNSRFSWLRLWMDRM